jgi:hypothetical protein
MQNLLIGLEQKIRDGFDPVINIELAFLKLMQMESSITIEAALRTLSGGSLPQPSSPAPPAESKKKLEITRPTPEPVVAPALQQAADSAPVATATTQQDVQAIWQQFLAALKPDHRNLQIKLSLAQPRSIEGNKFSVAFDRLGEVHVRYFQDRSQQQLLESVMKQASGREFRFNFFVDANWSQKSESSGTGGSLALAESERADHPLVAKAVEIFDADIVARRELKEK